MCFPTMWSFPLQIWLSYTQCYCKLSSHTRPTAFIARCPFLALNNTHQHIWIMITAKTFLCYSKCLSSKWSLTHPDRWARGVSGGAPGKSRVFYIWCRGPFIVKAAIRWEVWNVVLWLLCTITAQSAHWVRNVIYYHAFKCRHNICKFSYSHGFWLIGIIESYCYSLKIATIYNGGLIITSLLE